MRNYKDFYINGEWVTPQGASELEVINPATEEVAGVISLGNESHVDQAVEAARNAFDSWSQTSREERVAVLERVNEQLAARFDDLANAITEEMGAPLANFSNVVQVPAAQAHFMTATEILRNYEFEEQKGTTTIVQEPAGVCAMITPWNYPINQIACKVAPALAAGCTMVLKPSEVAPFDAYILAEVLDAAGVPAGVFNLVNGDGMGVGAPLTAHPGIDLISFTGSTRAGSLISQAAASTIKNLSLELGGKSANILLDDANLEEAVTHGMMSMLGNTGQSCNAPSRMLVHESQLAAAEQIAAAVCAQAAVGDPLNDATTMGPLASKAHFDKVQGLIKKGVDDGAKLVCGGTGLPDGIDKGYFTKPTVFSNVDNKMTIAQEEIFGPVLCLIPYKTDEEAIQIANDSVYGLSGYVSSADHERARKVARRLRTGNVHVNCAGFDFEAPFGGYKQSGVGREWGLHGIKEFLEVKAVMGDTAEAAA